MVRVREMRTCEQCGARFAPRREHARFCTARCRVAWNRAHTADPSSGVSALDWALTAMRDTTERLRRVRAADRPRAFAAIGEAVWWTTIVDATLVRHHPDAYDRALANYPAARRRLVEETFAGLRFVRNHIGHDVDHVDFICPAGDMGRITAWTWRPASEPASEQLPARGRDWEIERYRAYQARLARHPVGETFSTAAEFLKLAAAMAAEGQTIMSSGSRSLPERGESS